MLDHRLDRLRRYACATFDVGVVSAREDQQDQHTARVRASWRAGICCHRTWARRSLAHASASPLPLCSHGLRVAARTDLASARAFDSDDAFHGSRKGAPPAGWAPLMARKQGRRGREHGGTFRFAGELHGAPVAHPGYRDEVRNETRGARAPKPTARPPRGR